MKNIKRITRNSYCVRITLLLILIFAFQLSVPAPPSLKRSDFRGGAGDQKGDDLFVSPSPAPARGWIAGTNVTNGLLMGYDLTTFSPLFSMTLAANNTNFEALAVSGTTVYPVGAALPPSCGASDGVGDTEAKSMLARYTTAGAFIGCQSPNFFPYRGSEAKHAAIVVNEGGTDFVYTVGFAENCGFGNYLFVLTKYDASGAMINKVTEPGVSFTGFNCIGGSDMFGITALNGNIYVAGQSNLSGETGGGRPVLMKYDAALNRIWKARPSDVAGNFNAVAAAGGALYAVGSTSGGADYLIEKYDENNNRLWSKTSGGASMDVLTGVVGIGNRVFAVGYTNSAGAGGTDAAVLDIDPATGNTLSTTLYGGTQDDKANSAATDGTYLYVAGESKSFASVAGNVVGQNDAMLLQFCQNNCFVVTNTNDSGAGSLRQAITDANGSAGPNTIIFNIPTTDSNFAGGVFTIKPASSQLPTILNNITIDGATQTAFTGDTNANGPEIVLNGSLFPSGVGLFISGDNNTIKNLVVNGFSNGIGISWPNDSTPSNNQILNNYIGTDAAGTSAVPNSSTGLTINGFGSPSLQAQNNVVQNNLISGNGGGIGLCDAAQTNVTNNLIGTDRTGTSNLGNNGAGIGLACAGDPNSLIANNTIAFNNGAAIQDSPDYRFGVSMTSSGHQGNKFSQNSIHSNSGLGINLLPPPFGTVDNVTPNDNCDPDPGGNLLQNFPVITSLNTTGGTTTIQGTLNSTASTNFTLEFFANNVCDASGNGEGRTYIGSLPVTTGPGCTTGFTFNPASPVAANQFITATATDPANNTSEFSACAIMQSLPTVTIDDVSIAEGNIGTVNAVFNLHLSATSPTDVTVRFDTANDTAIAPADYVAAINGTATIPANTLNGTLSVTINSDLSFEGNERFFVNLSNPTNATIADAQASAVIADDEPTNGDFDNDGRTDAAVWNPSNGNWIYFNINTSAPVLAISDWGSAALGDIAVPGDYDGDKKTDIAVWRSTEGNWYIIKSTTGVNILQGWGQSGDVPVPGDYNGDGKTDYAVFRPSEGNWYILHNGGGNSLRGWGVSTDKPVPGDYDGDGKCDVAVFRPSEGNWYIINSATNTVTLQNWGLDMDRPVPGDYDGDGKCDLAVYRGAGTWYISNSSGGVTIKNWGDASDKPVPGNYDGDNKTDIAVWRPSEGNWYIIKSATGTGALINLGSSGNVPVPSAYQPQ